MINNEISIEAFMKEKQMYWKDFDKKYAEKKIRVQSNNLDGYIVYEGFYKGIEQKTTEDKPGTFYIETKDETISLSLIKINWIEII